jgi:hypothetical protein
MITAETPKTHIIVNDSKSSRVIPLDTIIRLEACGPYSVIYRKSGEEIVWSKKRLKWHVNSLTQIILFASTKGMW